MRIYILILCLSLSFGELLAQNEQQKINEIKSNRNYLYATGTSTASEQEASDNAQDLLTIEIEEWLKEKTTDDIAGYVAKSQQSLSMIRTQRGKLYRAFIYVKKKDVLPYYKEEEVMVVGFTDPQATNTDSIATERTIAEEPITPITEKPLIEEVVYTPTTKERAMIDVCSFTALNEYINQGRADGSIIEIGKYSTLPTTGTVYVFIHNRQGEIPACMKMTDGIAINLSTGKEDVIANYKGCGAIWIKYKN